MRIDQLGKTFTLLSVLLMLGLGAINLLTLGLYGHINAELMRERSDRQQMEAANWALQISATLQAGAQLEAHLNELASESAAGPAAIAVYKPDGKLQSQWLRPPAKGEDSEKQTYLIEQFKLETLLPRYMPAGPDPCTSAALARARSSLQSQQQKRGETYYTVYTVPIVYPGECAAFSTLVFRTVTPGTPWPLLVSLLQILTVVTMGVGGLLLLRVLLRPAVASARLRPPTSMNSGSDATEFVVGSLQSLIDGLQTERAELTRLHGLERQRAAFIEQFNELIVASIPGGLVVVEHTGYVIIANGRARALFGEESDEAAALRPLREVKYELLLQSAPRLCELIAACLQDGRTVELEEFEARRPDGTPRFLAATVSPMGWRAGDASVQGVLCLISDLSEVMELRQRLRLQENLANLGEMAAGIAHEFKNSLAAISGYSQLLQSVVADPTAQTSARALVAEVQNLSQVVTDFLNFARPQQLQLVPLSLQELVEDCRDTMLAKAQGNGIRLIVEGGFPEVLGDYTLLRRAFLNLIENGIEAIGDVDDKRITIRSVDENEENCAAIEISDTGVGIPTADLAKIFIPFFTTKSRGYGIGLALVQKIFLAHQGNVKVASQEGAGTTFICTLPRSQE